MSERKEALIALLEKVEAGEFAPELAKSVFGNRIAGFKTGALISWIMDPSDIRAMGAALALRKAVLPGWLVYGIDQDSAKRWYVTLSHVSTGGAKNIKGMWQHAAGECPAPAWLIAIIKALIAQEDA